MSKRLVAVALGLLLVSGCSDLPTSTSESVASGAPSLAVIPGVRAEAGTLGPGALYQMLVPDAWNGTLVLYAHGYADGEAPRLPDPTDPTDSEGQLMLGLTQLGFATAFSSFSENGLAIKDGAQRTKQLRGIFVSRFEKPARTIMMGGSLGGAIAVKLVEQFPQHYDGALTICGLIGGSQAEFDYMSNVRVLFEVFYPGVIPGSLYDLPAEDQRPAALAAAANALSADPTGAVAMQTVMAGLGTPIPGTGLDVLQAILVALDFNLNRFEDVLARTGGKGFFDNTEVDYGDPVINAVVDRFASTPRAENYVDQYYEPTGDLRIPMVSLHTSDDPAVPAFHEALYGQAVASAGNAARLDQIVVDRFGHCNFLPGEVLGALSQLLVAMGP